MIEIYCIFETNHQPVESTIIIAKEYLRQKKRYL